MDNEVGTLHRLLHDAGKRKESEKTEAVLEQQRLKVSHEHQIAALKKQLQLYLEKQRSHDVKELREYITNIVESHNQEKEALTRTFQQKHAKMTEKRDDMWREKIRERDATWKRWAADLQTSHDAALEAALQGHQ